MGKKPAESPTRVREATSPGDSDANVVQNDSDKDDKNDTSSSDSSSEEDPEMVLLMEENSGSSSSDDDLDGDAKNLLPKESVSKNKIRRQYDTPASNVAVLMVACWTLRLPVLYMDFIRLVIPRILRIYHILIS